MILRPLLRLVLTLALFGLGGGSSCPEPTQAASCCTSTDNCAPVPASKPAPSCPAAAMCGGAIERSVVAAVAPVAPVVKRIALWPTVPPSGNAPFGAASSAVVTRWLARRPPARLAANPASPPLASARCARLAVFRI